MGMMGGAAGGGGGVCPMCGAPVPTPGMGPGAGPQDAALAALGGQGVGVQSQGAGPMGADPLANMSPQDLAVLLQMLQAQGAGQPAPVAQGPGGY